MNSLTRITDDLYFAEGTLAMPGMSLPVRSHIVRDPDGLVTIISPIDFTGDAIAEIRALGERFQILAPNLLHHIFVPSAVKNFPAAELFSTVGMDRKRADVSWSKFLSDGDRLGASCTVHKIAGMPKVNELCVFHEPSKVLIVTDLFFNIRDPKGFLAPVIMRVFGNYRKFAVSRLFLTFMKDKVAFSESVAAILKLPIERIAVAHGEVLADDAKQVATMALRAKGICL
jgi:hypothetical protein